MCSATSRACPICHAHLVSVVHHRLGHLAVGIWHEWKLRLRVRVSVVHFAVRVGPGCLRGVRGRMRVRARARRRVQRAGVLAVVVHEVQAPGAAAGERAGLRCVLRTPWLLYDAPRGPVWRILPHSEDERFPMGSDLSPCLESYQIRLWVHPASRPPRVFASCCPAPSSPRIENIADDVYSS